MRYTKKPVSVEAVQWFPGLTVEGVAEDQVNDLMSGYQGPAGRVDTLEGVMWAMPGDMVITGVKGERYPCKPDIFEATYDVGHACKCSKTEPTTVSGLVWRCSSCEMILSPLKVLALYREGVLGIAEDR